MFVKEIIDEAQAIVGTNDKKLVYSRLTEAVRRLAVKPDAEFDPLVVNVDLCVANTQCGSFSLPRDVDTPLAVNIAGNPTLMRNRWSEFNFNGQGSLGGAVSWAWDDKGDYPVVMDLDSPAYLVATARVKTDDGRLIRVFGWDDNNLWVREQEEDGTWRDGLVYRANIYSRFAGGVLTFDEQRLLLRIFSAEGVSSFGTATPHSFVSGQSVVLTLITAPLPFPLISGTTYFVRPIDDNSVSLHISQEDALGNTGKIVATTNISNLTVMSIENKRGYLVQTKCVTLNANGIALGQLIGFSGSPPPSPLVITENYFARPLSSTEFTVHPSLDDANNGTNPIQITDVGTGAKVRSKRAISPVTELVFATPHNFLTQDSVTAKNAGGSLPSPLQESVEYFVHVVSATRITLHQTTDNALSGSFPIPLEDAGSGSSAIVKTIAAVASIGNSSNILANNHGLTIASSPVTFGTVSRARTANVATIVTDVPHGRTSGQFVKVENMGGSNYDDDLTPITVTGASSFTYANPGANEGVTADIGGSITTVPNDGDFVQFTTTGAFPSPLAQNTVYRAQGPMTANTFTVYNTNPAAVNILTTGTGNLELVISRAFSIGFNNKFSTDASDLATPDEIFLESDGALLATSPQVVQGTTYFVRKFDDEFITLHPTATDAINGTNTITILGLGIGSFLLAKEIDVSIAVSSPNIQVIDDSYLKDGALVTFSTTGVTPVPIIVGDSYKIVKISDGIYQVQLPDGTPQPILSIGSGDQSFSVQSNISVEPPSTLVCAKNNYNNGDAVTLLTSDTLPSPLLLNTTYYIRRIDDDNVALYDTKNRAIVGGVSGLIYPLDVGSGVQKFQQILPAVKFKKIDKVDKEASDDVMSLLAQDHNTRTVTLLGAYQHDELSPSYRRIRIPTYCKGAKNSWIRVRYRKRIFTITSDDDWIPLNTNTPILWMLRALDNYRKNFVQEGKAYEDLAVYHLMEETIAKMGNDTTGIQFFSDIYQNPDAQYME